MKKLAACMLLVILFAGITAPLAVSASSEHSVKIRVMSYNLHYGNSMGNVYDLNAQAEVIRQSGAEIIGLQEVDVHWGSRSLFEDDMKLLAEKLHMHYFFAPIYDLPPLNAGEPNRQFGVGVLSKYPIVRAVNREITRLSTQVPNPVPAPAPGFAQTLINVKGIKLHVYSTHLDYRADPAVRAMQVNDMLSILKESSRQKILFGDMNAQPNAPELKPLFSTLHDTWNSTELGLTFPANHPSSKIDYILTSTRIRSSSSYITSTLASDHRPIIADLAIPRPLKYKEGVR
ncbi:MULTISPECIES: endonuclease/exonuclease/phosphatase family protein [Fictibacillus]|uniref:Endonuclease/exonuclease/phosphatase family protein n=1 Tax=Fictibacillus terranigra TaxID=3058424 RepID=A0ABT8E1S2_9BACL|nr:endonuclease/exonuclease/phosphatase family protein [Fictibacillus sp. CENA-BCM004]MDN4071868.1 endonuclease/exonuclease/phosphatase family protein [Fictibacillus sp. CENA-BCM004]